MRIKKLERLLALGLIHELGIEVGLLAFGEPDHCHKKCSENEYQDHQHESDGPTSRIATTVVIREGSRTGQASKNGRSKHFRD